MSRCNKYIGDNDATCPQLTCIRGPGHPGPCDNTSGDFQVWGLPPFGMSETPVPISFAYQMRADAEVAERVAMMQMPSWTLTVACSETGPTDLHYGNEIKVCLSHADAIDLFRRLGW